MRTLSILILLFLTIQMSSCSKDFLYEKDNLSELGKDTIFVLGVGEKQTLQISLPKPANGEFTIVQYPKFMTFDSMKGNFTDGTTMFSFTSTYDIENYKNTGRNKGFLILDIKGYGRVRYVVLLSLKLTAGFLQYFNDTIKFDTQKTKEFMFVNRGNSPVNWSITSGPSSVTADKMSGTINPSGVETITFTVNWGDMSPGSRISWITFQADGAGTFQIPVTWEVLSQP